MMRKLFACLFLLFVTAIPPAAAEAVSLERIVALVNDDVVLASELEAEITTVRRELERRNVRMPQPQQLRRQVLERLIMQTLQMNVAERRGIRVDNATVDAAVRQVAERNGLSLAGLRDALSAEGLNMARFREQIRRDIVLNRLRQQEMNRRVDVSEQEIDQFIARNQAPGREYRLSRILIGVPEAASPASIEAARDEAQQIVQQLRDGEAFARLAATASDARNALEGGDLGWRPASQLPASAREAVETLAVGEITEPVRTPAGFQIYRLDDQRGSEQQTVRQAQLRHILIETNEVVTDADARLRLQTLRERILSGSDFSTLARANSDDPTSATAGGELGWVNPANLPPSFAEVVRRLEAGAISQPFRSRGGWHIAEVMAWREQAVSEQLAREEAAEAVRQRKAEEETELWLRELREEAYVEIRLDGLR
ncbi:peptidylprolyl isomerase [Spiribacter sp. 218]|jgi:peptidyl-prolyl cis-trans isomerase SurA|uniref:peptidylprolyl isomerase n=1 Tax=Spiribacter pallidus TaxID=1987936 RepID=UPI00349F4087